ncbi:MAG: hypothetical protein QNK05_12295 [Myxococcota bacterium]|nr:hypothetical protein [Myxococcota bacterium]
MSLRAFLKQAAGPAALFAAIALASPGVQVHAEGEALMSMETAPFASFGESAASCSVDAPPALSPTEIRQMTRQRLLAQMAAAKPGEEVRPLNGRGYNYKTESSPMAEMAILQAELAELEQQQQQR